MFATYILASGRNGTIYVGSTDDLPRRVWEHREKVRAGFTARYGVTQLVWFESHETRESAFRRERRIKEWRRSWKLLLIEGQNPTWRDLYEDLAGVGLKSDEWLAALEGGELDATLRDLGSGSPEFSNEVQHSDEGVLPWDGATSSSIWKRDVRLPAFAKAGNRSGKSLQLWIARHRASVAS